MATTMSMLAGLMQGYDSAAKSAQAQKLDDLKLQRSQTMDAMKYLMTAPNVAPEHQQWITQQYIEALHGDPTKPIKFDLSKAPIIRPSQAPPVQTPSFTGQTAPMQIQAPQDPNGPNLEPAQIPGQQVTIPGRSIPMPLAPPVNPNGGLVMRSPEEMANQQTQMEIARAQQLRAAGVLPPERPTVLAPGAAAFDSSGKQIASNTNPKPGDAPKVLSSGNVPYGIEANGKFYRGSESDKMPPEIKAQWQAVEDSQKQSEQKTEDKEQRQQTKQLERDKRLETFRQNLALQNEGRKLDMEQIRDMRRQQAESRKLVNDAQAQANDAKMAFSSANRAMQDVNAGKSGVADVKLIGAALGASIQTAKGGVPRVPKVEWDALVKARPILEGAQVKVENGFVNGAQLSQPQREEIMNLLQEKQQAANEKLALVHQQHDSVLNWKPQTASKVAPPASPSGPQATHIYVPGKGIQAVGSQ